MPFSIKVVVVVNDEKHDASYLNDKPELLLRFPDKARVNRNYASLKSQRVTGIIEIWETMIIVKNESNEVLWTDNLLD